MARDGTELGGPWRAAVATDDLRRDGMGLDFDDRSWTPVTVPGHWQNTPAFATSDGPLIYRHRFTLPRPAADERVFIVVEGVFYQADVWLDGAYLGDPEGYFFPHALEFTDLARLSDEHVLAIEVACPVQRDLTAKRNLTGVFQHNEFGRPNWNPGGLWRPVSVARSGRVRIDRLRVLCRDVGDERAHLRLHARLDSDDARRVRVRTFVDGVAVGAKDHSLAEGLNEIDWNVDVFEPRLWWPWGLGEQHLTDIAVEVSVDDELSDRHEVSTGLREVAMNNWVLSINGERLYAMGVNLAPTRLDIAEATAAQARHDVELARDAGLNLLRIQAHVAHPEVYAAADELGMMIWQDMPIQWGQARTIRKEAVRQARELVDHLGHHPSIVTWCAHNEPLPATDQRIDALHSSIAKHIAAKQLPKWGEVALDSWIRRALEHADITRPATARSGAVPRPPTFEGGASHLYFGWFHGEVNDLSGFAAAMPRMVRFVSDFGAPAAAVDRQALAGQHDRADLAPFQNHVPRANAPDAAAWVAATQTYQANLLRRQIETLRRLKYHPSGGFSFSSLFDPTEGISWGILDVRRSPKAAYQAVSDACQPVIIVADLLPPILPQGSPFAVDVHVVSEYRHPLAGATATATLHWPGGRHIWTWSGELAADGCTRVGTMQFVVPDVLGQLWLDLSVEYADGAASNRYVWAIVIPTDVKDAT